ncbi:hypothetical protein MJO28_009987 [Puccinia striiformis f. sp. tritici]|uniref:Uncharacterized protein n=1 Tax=Puccinia striiformis f. sp. tritici TaxID=168172 RepID=A0ACC0EAN0_9BASI|nr:hypothetical protein Pst134EB_018117 [Puccinia striiformis f. sp. tritici]KAI7948079.1 hypothetical protein MJO28_009987 [Puccinia striiformis f. sp. tritici]KAI7951072.1 hypothetical protein MJO29_009746 [Puccinia striiformis f. sp. tritici]
MLSSPPKTTPAQAPAPAIVKRRRKSGKGQGESSREASAESNDETATDNDPMADDTDTASMSSPRNARNSSRNRAAFEESHHTLAPPHRHKRPPTLATTATINNSIPLLGKEESALRLSSSGINPQTGLESGLDSSTSTYDGDVSSAPGPADKRGHTTIKHPQAIQSDDLSTQSIKTGSGPGSSMNWAHENSNQQAGLTSKASPTSSLKPANPNLPPAPHGILSRIAPEDLQAEMKEAIQNSSKQRSYPINPPPTDRPVRIYADGVYDLFHYGHALQLRQCKLFFPSVYLMVGVCSDELVRKFKASPVLTSAERYESVANCKWVDQVVEDAPWQVDAAFLEKHQIDYVAHDEEPYVSLNSDDVYAYAKSIGKFLPTRRTDGVSTSELLQRIVGGYIEGTYDNKLEKIGAGDLCSNIAFSDAGSGVHRGAGSRTPMVPRSPVHHSTTDAEMDDGTRTASTVLDPVQ